MCQWGSSVVTNVPVWRETLEMGEAVYVWGTEGIWKVSVPSSQIFYGPKTNNNNNNNNEVLKQKMKNSWMSIEGKGAYKGKKTY